jgi:lipoprotein-releasing system permease protein
VRYELLVGLRYTRAKRRNRFISFISLISLGGIALGVWALIVVLSVMNGFQKEVRARILGVVSHMQISAADGTLADWEQVAARVKANAHVIGSAPFVNAQGMLVQGQAVRGAVVRGILPEREAQVAEIGEHMREGTLASLQPGAFNIVLGIEIARALGVRQGDKITLVAPQGLVTPAGMVPRLKQFTVSGIFQVDHYEYDAGLALVRLEDAQKLYQTGERVSGLRLKLDDLFAAPLVTRELAAVLGPDLYASDWTRSHANFFRAVDIEKRMMMIILTLIVAVAAFNIVSTLVMLVTDKQADIAILRTLGASPGSVMQIFVIQGLVLGLLGTLLGAVTGVITAWNVDVIVPAIESLLGFKFLSRDVYFITDLPSEVRWADVGTIVGMSVVISFLATLPPSWRAARINPAEALRYE